MIKKISINSKSRNQSFDKRRFWLGIIVGLLYAVTLYSFLNLAYLTFDFAFYYDWVGYSVTVPLEVKYFHFFFAFVGLIMGQLVFLEFLINKNRSFRENPFKNFNAFTNTRFSIWNTFYFGFAWATYSGLLTFVNIFAIYKFHGIGWWASLLSLIWLQLYVSSQFQKIFHIGFKTSFIHFIGICLTAFLFSQIQFIDYAEAYKSRVENFPHYKLKIDLPVVPDKNATSKLTRRSLVTHLFVGDPEKDDIPNYCTYSGSEFPFNSWSIKLHLENFRLGIRSSNQSYTVASLFIDKHLKMKHVHQLFLTLEQNDQYKISLATLTSSENIPNLYYKEVSKYLLLSLPYICPNLKYWKNYLEQNPNISFKDFKQKFESNTDDFCYADIFENFKNEIKIESDDSIFFQNTLVSKEDLFEIFKSISLEKDNPNWFVLNVYPNVSYGLYFHVRHEYQKALDAIRNEKALIHYGAKFLYLDKEKQRKIRTDYPLFMVDLLSQEERFIYNFFKEKQQNK